jgi:hypothetical protein
MDDSSEMLALSLAGEGKLVDLTGEKQKFTEVFILRRLDLDEVDRIGRLQRKFCWNRKEDGRILIL